jgi:hypothetical protein
MDDQEWRDEEPGDDDIAQEFPAPGFVGELFKNCCGSFLREHCHSLSLSCNPGIWRQLP